MANDTKANANPGDLRATAPPAQSGNATPARTTTAAGGNAAPARTATAAVGKGGLANVPEVVELADQLTACADQLHERIMRDIRAYDGGPVPDRVQAAARALLEDELTLRQRANGLYADAATFIVKSLGKSQQGIVALTSEAAEKIRKIALIGDVTGLVAGLLHLAGAAVSGQPGGIITALEKINTQLKAIKTHSAPPPKKV